MSNIVYVKTKHGKRKLKTFTKDSLKEAIKYGYKKARKNPDENYFLIDENQNIINFNINDFVY